MLPWQNVDYWADFAGQFGHVKLLDQRTRWDWEKRWRARFLGTILPSLPKGLGRRPWNFFWYGLIPGVERQQARRAYESIKGELEYVVLPEYPEAHALLVTGALPTLESWDSRHAECPMDVYIFPTDLSWTMVFVHESGVGPYFSEGSAAE